LEARQLRKGDNYMGNRRKYLEKNEQCCKVGKDKRSLGFGGIGSFLKGKASVPSRKNTTEERKRWEHSFS